MRKSDVEFHAHGASDNDWPAVNVKITDRLEDVQLPLQLGSYSDDQGQSWQANTTDAGFTVDWVRAHLSESTLAGIEEDILADAWVDLQAAAAGIWPDREVTVYSAGRSGGWAIVDGLPDFDGWDAIELGRWAQFVRAARTLVDYCPQRILSAIYFNHYPTP